MKARSASTVAMTITIVNLGLWIAETVAIGGEGFLEGAVRNGHYFVGTKQGLTEVSHGVYTLSLIHSAITLVTFLPCMFGSMIGMLVERSREEAATESK